MKISNFANNKCICDKTNRQKHTRFYSRKGRESRKNHSKKYPFLVLIYPMYLKVDCEKQFRQHIKKVKNQEVIESNFTQCFEIKASVIKRELWSERAKTKRKIGKVRQIKDKKWKNRVTKFKFNKNSNWVSKTTWK